ncbi:MAG: hypothetical protein ACXU86_12030 [Archangium sp.]
MPIPKQMLCAALAAGCFIHTAPAEARFGKGGGGSPSSSSHSSGGGSHSSGSPSSGGASSSGGGGPAWMPHFHGASERPRVHDATPVGRDSDGSSPGGGRGGGGKDPGPRRPVFVPGSVWMSPSEFYGAYGYRPHPVATQEPDEPSHPVMVRMGVEGYAVRAGGGLGFNLGIEERRWGVSTRLTGLSLDPDDGSEGRDHIQLAEAHVTFSPLAGEHGRLRLEGGVAAARAPDVTFVGPSLAMSFERCLFGPFDVEGRVQWVPVPHLQLDGQAGLAVHLGVLTLRGGWRALLLDDRGLVDGEVHREAMGGPFGGVGLNF